jgi:hypothetical protein
VIARRATDFEAVVAALGRIKAQIQSVCDRYLGIESGSDMLDEKVIEIDVTDSAYAKLEAWAKSIEQTDDGDDNPHSIRLADIVRRFLAVLAVTNDVSVIDDGLMELGIQFGKHVLSARQLYTPDDAVNDYQMFENLILRIFKQYGKMTKNQLVQRITPNKRPGGFRAFNSALKELGTAGRVVKCGETHKGTDVLGFPKHRVR